MTEKEIKSAAKRVFDNGDYSLAFQILWKLEDAGKFVSYAEKVRKEEKKNNWFTSEYFWTDFILQPKYFFELLKSESSIQLLHHYFKSYEKPVDTFEKKVAEAFPELFVKAIRLNQVFLKPDRIEFLQSLELGEKFHIHQKFWEYCSKTDVGLWKHIQLEFENVKQLPIDYIFCHLIIWLEAHRFQNSDKALFYHLSKVYSFFIELLLSEHHFSGVQNLNSDDLFNRFSKLTRSVYCENEIIKSSLVRKSLEFIFAWINFYDNAIIPYCFDLNFEPIKENDSFSIRENPEANTIWKKGELRYEANKFYYDQLGFDMVSYLEEEHLLVIPGKTECDIEMNRDVTVIKWATASILEDIQHEYFKIGGEGIQTEKLLMPLLGFTKNRYDRYEKNLDFYMQTSKNWVEAFLKLKNLSALMDVQFSPFILITEYDYKKLNGEVFSEMGENSTDEVLKLFSFRKHENNPFNRFDLRYDVYHKPFIRFNNLLFTPTMFFANNDWFYTFTELALRNSDKSISTKMEKYLASKFEEKGFQIKVATDKEASEIEGDVDVFVEDGETLLYVQLKRTKLRLNSEDIYNEIVNVDSKASRQLNSAEQFLKSPNKVYDTKGKQPVKWIVTTSYENVGESINDCQKVNYFDVLYVLRTFEIGSLKDLIFYIETEVPLNNFIKLKKRMGLQ